MTPPNIGNLSDNIAGERLGGLVSDSLGHSTDLSRRTRCGLRVTTGQAKAKTKEQVVGRVELWRARDYDPNAVEKQSVRVPGSTEGGS